MASTDKDSDQSNSNRLDEIGKMPRNSSSGSDVSSAESLSSNSNQSAQQTPKQSSRNASNRRTTRKQPTPKKRKDRAFEEIKNLQQTTKLLIPKLPFQRLVREVLQKFDINFKIQTQTVECLHEASEAYLTGLFEDANLCCMHRQRLTLQEKDLKLVRVLRGPNDPGRK